MSWLEAKYRRSEEKAEKLQLEELEKISDSKARNYEIVSKLVYDKYGVSTEQVELSYVYLSNDTGCSDYGSDTYRLAKEAKAYGRIVKFDTVSPIMVRKHKLYDELASAPASHRFPTAIDYSPLLDEITSCKHKYKYKSCYMPSSEKVIVVLKHWLLDRVECQNMDVMSDGLPATMNREFTVVAEEDFGDIRVIFLLATSID